MAEDDGLKELMSTLLRAGAVRRSDDSALIMCPEDGVDLDDEGLSKHIIDLEMVIHGMIGGQGHE